MRLILGTTAIGSEADRLPGPSADHPERVISRERAGRMRFARRLKQQACVLAHLGRHERPRVATSPVAPGRGTSRASLRWCPGYERRIHSTKIVRKLSP
jgi:hypothetical protein